MKELPKHGLGPAPIYYRRLAGKDDETSGSVHQKPRIPRILLADKNSLGIAVFNWDQAKVNPEDMYVIFTENWWDKFADKISQDISNDSYRRLKKKFDEAMLKFRRVCTQRNGQIPSLVLDDLLVNAVEDALNNKVNIDNLCDCFEHQAILFELMRLDL